MHEGEELIWGYREEKGIINKTLVRIWAVTNFRIFCYNYEIEDMEGLLLMQDLDDVVVTNTHRESESHGTYYGRYVKYGYRKSKSTTIGDIMFMSGGTSIITLRGITDPHGLARIVKSIKKQMYPAKKIERLLKQQEDSSICNNCGNKNPKKASFCNKCGFALK